MRFLKRVHLKKYFLSILMLSLASLFFIRSKKEIIGILVILFATLCNHILLVEGVVLTVENPDQLKAKAVLKRAIAIFFGKFAILIFGIYIGVQFMGPRVIIPVILYVISIFILVLSIKKLEQEKI